MPAVPVSGGRRAFQGEERARVGDKSLLGVFKGQPRSIFISSWVKRGHSNFLPGLVLGGRNGSECMVPGGVTLTDTLLSLLAFRLVSAGSYLTGQH